MNAKNLKDLKSSIKAESDWVYIQLKNSKKRRSK
jgi:hypothetical protein